MKKLNIVTGGQAYPLNYASRLVKTSSDIMFSISVNDEVSVESRLRYLEQTIQELRENIRNLPSVED